jgi:hypothetical protein
MGGPPWPRKGHDITICRYYPGNHYHLVNGTVVTVSKGWFELLIDRTPVLFPRPQWQWVIET